MFRKISKNFEYKFNVKESGIFTITIEASCQSGKFLGLFGGADFRVEIDGKALREIPAQKRRQYYNIPPAWNGTKLKGLTKTIIFILKLEKGEHNLKFIPKREAIIESEPEIKLINTKQPEVTLLENIQAQEGDRRPWTTLALINLPLKILDIRIICQKRKGDSDDVKIIIDGKIQKNRKSGWWGKNWYWRGSELKGNEASTRFYPQLEAGLHYIEFWADRMPVLKEISVSTTGWLEVEDGEDKKEDKVRKYTYKGVNGDEDYNRYDTEIEEQVSQWNKEFLNDKVFPVPEPLDPSLVKAIIYQESRVGYAQGGEVDIMQVGNPQDPALSTLKGELVEYEIKDGEQRQLKYPDKDVVINNPVDSIKWGVRWLYHKAQEITGDNEMSWRSWKEAVHRYGPGTDKYTDNLWKIYQEGIDERGKTKIKLWSLFLTPFLLIASLSWVYFNQGRVFFKYKDRGEEYVFVGRLCLEVGVLDGFKIKKATIGPIYDDDLGSFGLKRETILVDPYDFENDGQEDILVSSYHATGRQVYHFFRIGKDRLEEIHVTGSDSILGDNNIYGEYIFFGGRDEKDRLVFIEKNIVRYSNAPYQSWKNYYGFNDYGGLDIFKKEKEDIL